MSFEANLGSRLSFSKHDVPETNLDFYSRPENYEGSNIHTLNKFVLKKKKQEQEQAAHLDKQKKQDDPMQKLFDRYKDIANDDEEPEGSNDLSKTKRHSLQVPLEAAYTNTSNSYGKNQRSLSSLNGADHSRKEPKELTREELYRRRRTVTAPLERTLPEYKEEPSSESVDVIDADSSDTMRHRRSRDLRTPSPSPRESRATSVRSDLFSDSDTFRGRHRLAGFGYEMARQRFKHAIKIVLILLKWISTLTEKEDSDAEKGGKTFTDIASEAFAQGELKASGIAFDVSQFKAKKEVNISKEVKHILSIPSTHRTPEQLQIALYGLQHLKSFAEYPLHMQEKLCKVAWYQLVPPNRVIIRQGHFAENFYFLLSGQAVVRILDKNKNGEIQLRTAAVMRKGTSFGELALLHHSRRTATVVSQDNVQLLTIGREDFFDIFMKVSEEDGIPDHVKFTMSVDFMKHFPLEKLLEHPEVCLFHFFKRGVVIVKDCNESDWLYIVKSGSCQVMKQLKGVRPTTGHENKEGEKPNDVITKLPRLGGLGSVAGKIDTGLRKQMPKPQVASALRRAITQYDTYLTQMQDNDAALKQPSKENNSNVNGDENKNSKTSMSKSSPLNRTPSPGHAKSKQGFSKSKYSFLLPTQPKKGAKRRIYAAASSVSTPTKSVSDDKYSAYLERSRTLNSMHHPAKAEQEQDAAPLEPVFVQVDVLKPKDVFGLSTIQFDDDIEYTDTSVSLVSNGAECIMLSKKFFAQNANEQVKQTIRHLVRPYPTEDSLQHNLQTQVDWEQFKTNLLVDTVVHLPIANARRPATMPVLRTSVPS